MRSFLFFLAFFPLGSLPSASFAQNPPAAPAKQETPSTFGEKITVRGVHNAGKINDHLYRGAQPDVIGLSELKNLGVNTIVDLRRESTSTLNEEKARATTLGVRFVSIPLGGFSNPTSEQLAQFFSLLREDPQPTIFVHCQFGEDRSGVFIAAYRIAFEHWTSDQAMKEMLHFGFNHNWHPAMRAYVRSLPEKLQSDAVLKSSLAGLKPSIASTGP
jgi:tyrosine-protein phosphatase SIW14